MALGDGVTMTRYRELLSPVLLIQTGILSLSTVEATVVAVAGVIGWNWYGSQRSETIATTSDLYVDYLQAEGAERETIEATLAAYGLDEIILLPGRRTRDADLVDLSWQIDAYSFDTPIISSAMDSVTSPATAIALDKLGGLGVLDLEGVWTRHEDPGPALAELAGVPVEVVLGHDEQRDSLGTRR